jgi:hypothetical protein
MFRPRLIRIAALFAAEKPRFASLRINRTEGERFTTFWGLPSLEALSMTMISELIPALSTSATQEATHRGSKSG